MTAVRGGGTCRVGSGLSYYPVVSWVVSQVAASDRRGGAAQAWVHWAGGRRGLDVSRVVRFPRTVPAAVSGSRAASTASQKGDSSRLDAGQGARNLHPWACCCKAKGVSARCGASPVFSISGPVQGRARQTQVLRFLAMDEKVTGRGCRAPLQQATTASAQGFFRRVSSRFLAVFRAVCQAKSLNSKIVFDCPDCLSHAPRLRSRPCRVAARANQRRLLV